MSQQNVVLTGGSRGIGFATAKKLARPGINLFIVCSDEVQGAKAIDEITRTTGHDQVTLLGADLSSMASVVDLADRINRGVGQVHVLIHNAGVACTQLETTVDGFEKTFAVNHLAMFLLTRRLLPSLIAAAPSRVVVITSQIHSKDLDFDNLQGEKHFDGGQAYRLSKLANILFTKELSRKLADRQVTANCLHPGVVMTRLLINLDRAERGLGPAEVGEGPPRWSPKTTAKAIVRQVRNLLGSSTENKAEKAAETSIFLALDESLQGVSGDYFVDKVSVSPADICNDEEVCQRFWATSERLLTEKGFG